MPIQVEAPNPCTSVEKATARRLLQDVFTKPAAAAAPVAQLNQSAAPGQAQQEVEKAHVPYQATWPSAPGLWALGNKSRSAMHSIHFAPRVKPFGASSARSIAVALLMPSIQRSEEREHVGVMLPGIRTGCTLSALCD